MVPPGEARGMAYSGCVTELVWELTATDKVLMPLGGLWV